VKTTDDAPYRYELWKLDTKTLVHGRITGDLLQAHDPALLERGPFTGYPEGYEWRLYQEQEELARWDAERPLSAKLPKPTAPAAAVPAPRAS
jgi:hypothetical protein